MEAYNMLNNRTLTERTLSDLFKPYNSQFNENSSFKIPHYHWLDFGWDYPEVDLLMYHAAVWC